MLRNRRLAGAIADCAWGEFRTVLDATNVILGAGDPDFIEGDDVIGAMFAAGMQLTMLMNELAAAGVEPPLRHLSNSAATLTRPSAHLGLVRVGALSSAKLRRNRRLGYLIVVAIGVALPGVDPFTTALETVPLLVLFEASIWLAVMFEARWRSAALAAGR